MTTSTLEVTEFLLARIAEDEEMARSAAPHFPGEMEIVSEVWEDAVAHIAHQSPARVLAECEAKRQIVEMHDGKPTDSMRTVLRILASVYADHPDYRQEWAL